MKRLLFGSAVYQLVGAVTGFVLCPLSLAGIAGPFLYGPDSPAAIWFGRVMLTSAALLVASNVYFCCRRQVVRDSASFFPVFAALSASGGVAALHGGAWFLPALAGFGVLDLIGQPILGGIVAGLFRADA